MNIKDIRPGSRCRIIRVHHPCFNHRLGQAVIVVSIFDENNVLVYDDKPFTYRINRKGERVVDRDPRCIREFIGPDELELVADD